MMVMEKGVCRQLLDWLIEQIEILDQHIETMADAAGDSREVVDLLDRQLRDAREWLCQQLWTRSKPAASSGVADAPIAIRPGSAAARRLAA
jgi:hypothetical protein